LSTAVVLSIFVRKHRPAAAVEATGFAAEIIFPTTLQRFEVFEPDAPFVLVSLTFASWLYHFCQIGASAYGASHLPGGLRDGRTAQVAGPGGLRGRAADVLARPVAASGCPGEISIDRSGLGANDYLWC
jgi:hypothetical protein